MLNHKVLFLAIFISLPATSGEVITSHVSHNDNVFSASIEMQIDAPADKVYALLTDYKHLPRLNDNIINSDLIEATPPEYIVQIQTHNCVLFFCKDLQQTQKVNEFDAGYISVEDIKGQSDFKSANSYWHIYTHGEGTRVTFSSEMEPDFWLPPLLGAWLFKKRFIKETQKMIQRMEQLASHE